MNASTVKKKTNNYGSIPEQPEEEKEKTFEIDIGLWEASIGLVVYLILGVVAYSFILEKWSMVDSFYFSIVTFTTVGYGDLYPSTNMGRVFTFFFSFIGVAFIGICFGALGDNLVKNELDAFEDARKSIMTALLTADDDDEINTSDKNNSSLALSQGENNQSTTADNIAVSYLNHNKTLTILSTLPVYATTIVSLGLVLLGAYTLGSREAWNWCEVIYFAMITATSVGYGDYVPNPENRLFAGFYIMFAVATAAYFIGYISNSLIERRRGKVLEYFQSSEVEWKDITVMDTDKNGKISKREYVEYMLASMNIVDSSLIQELHKRFDALDTDKSGFLSQEDVILRSQKRVENIKKKLSPAKKNDVSQSTSV